MPERPPKETVLSPEHASAIQQNGALLDKLFLINATYPYWDEIRANNPRQADRDFLWAVLKWIRESGARRFSLAETGFRFNYTPPMLRRLHEFDLLAGRFPAMLSGIDTDLHAAFRYEAALQDTIYSGRLAGYANPLNIDALLAGKVPTEQQDRAFYNLFHLMRAPLSAPFTLTPEQLFNWQQLITASDNTSLRVEPSHRNDPETNEVIYHAPAPEHLKDYVNALCDFANADNNPFIHPIARAAVLQFMLTYIRPFPDGNGRLARLVTSMYLKAHGYWFAGFISPAEVLAQNQTGYIQAFVKTEYDNNDLTYFINYFVEILAKALDAFEEKINAYRTAYENLVKRTHEHNLNARQLHILSLLKENKARTFTIKEIQHRYDVVYQTARTDLLELADAGLMNQNRIGSKGTFSLAETVSFK